MSKMSSASKIELKKFDDLFGSEDMLASDSALSVVEIPLNELYEFKDHPFKIHEDELEEMVESVRQYGILVPGICRIRADGGYEIVAGHTRCEACRRVGLETVPMIIKELSDDEAIIIMVDSNIQRENVLISEKARAYKMRYDAIKHQGVKGNSLQLISEETGENAKKIQRYIRLARLCDALLELVDTKKLPVAQALDLSFLKIKEQAIVLDVMKELCLVPTKEQTSAMKEAEQFSFYRIPRMLIKDTHFSALSSDAKILYGLMLDRMSLSMRNGWQDDEDRTYVIYTIDNIMEDLNCCKTKAVKTLNELDVESGIGLVEKKRQGLGKPDLIYVKNFVGVKIKEEIKDTEVVSDINSDYVVDETIYFEDKDAPKVRNFTEVHKMDFKKSTEWTSRGSSYGP